MRVYEFVGGDHHGKIMFRSDVEKMSNGYTEDLSDLRAKGCCVHRAELDNQPKVPGYLGPMWDGLRYIVNGEWKYEFQCSAQEKADFGPPIEVLRYETQDVYNMLSR